jgi:hypothetical protein
VRFYEIKHAAKVLNEQQKVVFQTEGGALYAVEQHGDVPVNFRRVDKDRRLKGKARKQARREQRRMLNDAQRFAKDAGQ